MPRPIRGATLPGGRYPATSAHHGSCLRSASTTGSRTSCSEHHALRSNRIVRRRVTMNDRTKLHELIGPRDSTLLFEAMRRGITRRQMLQLLLAGGMQASLAGSLAGIAGNAYAQTPKKGGRIR